MFKRVASISVMLLILVTSVYAQYTGKLQGRVVDKDTKQPLQGANILINGTKFGATTDLNGNYLISNVPEDLYKVRFSFLGYNNFVKSDVRVVRGKVTYLQDTELKSSNINMESVVISSGAFYDDSEIPVSDYSYTKEELNRNPGSAGDVFRALAAMPGVSIGSGGEFAAFSVRGGTPYENVFLIDNIPFSKVTHLEGGGSEEELGQGGRFSIFTPSMLSSVDFQGGAFPAKYGGKNSSLINIHIKEGNRSTPTFSAYYDLFGGEVTYDGPSYFHKNTSLLFSARHIDMTNVLDMVGEGEQGSPVFSDIILKSTTDINDKHRLSLLGIYAPETYKRDVEHLYKADNLLDAYLADRKEEKMLAGLNWRMLTGRNSFLHTTLYATNTELSENDGEVFTDPINGHIPTESEVLVNRDKFHQKVDESTYGAKTEFYIKPTKNTSLTTGIEMEMIDFSYLARLDGLDTSYVFDEHDYRSDPSQYFVINDPAHLNANYDKFISKYAGYTQFSHDLTDKMVITPGVRLEYNSFNEDIYVLPRLSARFKVNSRTSLNIASGIYKQMPKNEIIAVVQDAKSLKNETSYHLITGISSYLSNEWKFNFETYIKLYDDMITHPDQTRPVYTNQGEGVSTGFDVSLIRRLSNKFFGQISYSYSISKRDDHNGEGKYNSNFNKPHIFNVMGGYEFSKEWKFSANWQFASGYPTDSYIVHKNVHNDTNYMRYSQEITGNNAGRIKNSHTLNVRVDYRKQLGRIATIFYIDILNAYDNLNITEMKFTPRDGGIEENGFSMLPTLGLKLEF